MLNFFFEEEALRAIAQQAQDQHTGARGLRGIMEDILTDLMFEAPSDPTIDKIIITEGVIKKTVLLRKLLAKRNCYRQIP